MRKTRLSHLLLFVFLAGSGAWAQEPAAPLFTIGAVADVQYADTDPRGNRTPREAPRRLREAAECFNRHNVDFVVSLGDFIDWDDINYATFRTTNEALDPVDWTHFTTVDEVWQTIHAPRYHVLGNHEWCVPDRAHDGAKPERVFKRYGFEEKAYHDFKHKGFRFVVLDGTDRYMYAYPKDSDEYLDAKSYYDSLARRSPWDGAMSSKQLDWLKATLADAEAAREKVVIFCHFPIHEPSRNHNLLNSLEVSGLLDGFPNVVLWLNGHNHQGGYALMNGRRHHLNLKGMQNFDDTHCRLAFYPDRIEVYRAEALEPERVLPFAPGQ